MLYREGTHSERGCESKRVSHECSYAFFTVHPVHYSMHDSLLSMRNIQSASDARDFGYRSSASLLRKMHRGATFEAGQAMLGQATGGAMDEIEARIQASWVRLDSLLPSLPPSLPPSVPHLCLLGLCLLSVSHS